jgi:hypothetical protein
MARKPRCVFRVRASAENGLLDVGWGMKKRDLVSLIVALLVAGMTWAQLRPPEIGRKLPDPGPNRIEVRFALGKKAVRCEQFYLSAKVNGQIIVEGWFASGFQVPSEAKKLPENDALELEFNCGRHRWHLNGVPEAVFRASWWWVGTDYPPFQETFQGQAMFQDAAWIRYLIVDPQGFFFERHCPKRFKDQKPGPCYDQ